VGEAILQASGQAWPPFVLVTGLLLIGAVVEADGLFAALGTRIERIGGGPVASETTGKASSARRTMRRRSTLSPLCHRTLIPIRWPRRCRLEGS
jgi:hypothetical protein